MKNKEYCIMPIFNEREPGLERHEVLFGTSNRKKSIEDGLVVFITPEMHRGTEGVHLNREFDLELKRIAEKTWCDYYNKTIEDFIKRFGRNYL